MATYLHEARTQSQASGALSSTPKAGDTLVLSGLGALGESYAEIVEAMRDLMRRQVVVRSVNEGLIFDGSVADVGAQASRDALIALAAAAAETKKTAKRKAAQLERVRQPEPAMDVRAAGLQAGVIGVQLGALALAAYLISFIAPGPHRPSTAPPQQTSIADRPQKTTSPAAEPQRYATGEFLVEKPPAKTRTRSDDLARSLGPPQPIGDAEIQEKPLVTQTLGLSRDKQLKIFAAVGAWRSAKVKSDKLRLTVGAAVPPGIHLATFPRGLVRDEPILRGYKFIVQGQLIGVVDSNKQIVATLSGP